MYYFFYSNCASVNMLKQIGTRKGDPKFVYNRYSAKYGNVKESANFRLFKNETY